MLELKMNVNITPPPIPTRSHPSLITITNPCIFTGGVSRNKARKMKRARCENLFPGLIWHECTYKHIAGIVRDLISLGFEPTWSRLILLFCPQRHLVLSFFSVSTTSWPTIGTKRIWFERVRTINRQFVSSVNLAKVILCPNNIMKTIDVIASCQRHARVQFCKTSSLLRLLPGSCAWIMISNQHATSGSMKEFMGLHYGSTSNKSCHIIQNTTQLAGYESFSCCERDNIMLQYCNQSNKPVFSWKNAAAVCPWIGTHQAETVTRVAALHRPPVQNCWWCQRHFY